MNYWMGEANVTSDWYRKSKQFVARHLQRDTGHQLMIRLFQKVASVTL
jgi:hypothetical protein